MYANEFPCAKLTAKNADGDTLRAGWIAPFGNGSGTGCTPAFIEPGATMGFSVELFWAYGTVPVSLTLTDTSPQILLPPG